MSAIDVTPTDGRHTQYTVVVESIRIRRVAPMMAIVPVVALICTGLAAGIFLGHRAGVSRAVPILSPSSFIQLQQTINKSFARMMPVLIIGSVLGSALWAVLLRACWRTAEF